MARSARKEREIQERQERMLDIARRILLDEGFHALSMDRIAAEIDYSKGTVYQHFASKEDLLAGLVEQTHLRRIDFFERAATFPGRARERIMAVGVAIDLFVSLYPAHFRAEQIVSLTADPERVLQDRIRRCFAHESRCFQIVNGIVRDGVASGDLALRPPVTTELVTFGLWALSFGAHFIGSFVGDMAALRIPGSVHTALGVNINAHLDGLGFRPLSGEHDYEQTMDRVRAEVFADESRRAKDS